MSVRLIALFAFDDVQVLDVTGPASVFGVANTLGGREAYKVVVVSPGGGLIESSCGVIVQTLALSKVSCSSIHTLLIAGGSTAAMQRATADPITQKWMRKCARSAKRFGSICSGALVLARLGLLGKARVATHWASCEALAEFSDISVDANSLFVVDGKLWTSAGVSTGIDMTLAMVEWDIGRPLADRIAKFMVLYSRRPGFQSQFSELLKTQTASGTDFGDLAVWMQDNITRPVDVPALAARTGLTERTFYRKFVKTTGQTPAKFVETLRLDAARSLLSTGLPLKTIAARTGMTSAHRLAAAFERRFGVTPSSFRRMHFGSD
jgi:transcriptional regulator GlxA family with amidase domain